MKPPGGLFNNQGSSSLFGLNKNTTETEKPNEKKNESNEFKPSFSLLQPMNNEVVDKEKEKTSVEVSQSAKPTLFSLNSSSGGS